MKLSGNGEHMNTAVVTIDDIKEEYIDVTNAISFFCQETQLFKEVLVLVAKSTSRDLEKDEKDSLIKAAARKIMYCNTMAQEKFIKKFVDIRSMDELDKLTDAFWAMCYEWAERRLGARMKDFYA